MQLISDALNAALRDLLVADRIAPPQQPAPEIRRSVDEVESGQ